MSSECLGMWTNNHLAQRCRLAATAKIGLVVFVHAPDAPHCPPVHVLEGGVVLPVARHLEAPEFVQNVLESVAEELDLRPPRRPLLRPFQLHGLPCSDSH